MDEKFEVNKSYNIYPGYEHLKSNVKPIMACVGTKWDFEKDPGPTRVFNWYGGVDSYSDLNNSMNRNVDYYGDSAVLQLREFKNPEPFSYVISPVDNKDKFSSTFRNCTGVLVAGVDKITGENISFLSHQDPVYFLKNNENTNKLAGDLIERMSELKARCEDGTVDAIVLGGNFFDEEHLAGRKFDDDYIESVKLLSSKIEGVFGFNPVIITGPKTITGDDNVFYDNKNRRIYLVRPRVGDKTTDSYVIGRMNEKIEEWKKI